MKEFPDIVVNGKVYKHGIDYELTGYNYVTFLKPLTKNDIIPPEQILKWIGESKKRKKK